MSLTNEIKLPIYQKLGFTPQDILEGETLYGLMTERDKNELAYGYFRITPKYELFQDIYNSYPKSLKIAVINIAESGSYPQKFRLSNNLYYGDNYFSRNVFDYPIAKAEKKNRNRTDIRQEFFYLNYIWLLSESDPEIKRNLTKSLIEYTRKEFQAKQYLVDNLESDGFLAKIIISWLPMVGDDAKGYDLEFAHIVWSKILKAYDVKSLAGESKTIIPYIKIALDLPLETAEQKVIDDSNNTTLDEPGTHDRF